MRGYATVILDKRREEYILLVCVGHPPELSPNEQEVFTFSRRLPGKTPEIRAKALAQLFARVREEAYDKRKLLRVLNLPHSSTRR